VTVEVPDRTGNDGDIRFRVGPERKVERLLNANHISGAENRFHHLIGKVDAFRMRGILARHFDYFLVEQYRSPVIEPTLFREPMKFINGPPFRGRMPFPT